MAVRTLSQRELNRALLARQLLLARASAPLPRVLERVCGIQAQYAPSSYIGLWSRVAGFQRAHLDRALERRTVVQGTLMRATIHLVSARDYWAFARAVDAPLRDWWFRVTKHGSDAEALAEIDRRARALLADGPMTRAELIGRLGGDPAVWAGVGLFTPLLRVPPSGTWTRRRADLYAAAADELGPSDVTPDAGVELLVRRYLAGFGPATRQDIASFAMLPAAAIADALARLPIRRFATEDGKDLVDLRGAPLPDPDTPAPARFLPTWDATLLVHARRTQILPEEYRAAIFSSKTPHSFPTFLVDGQVAGTWRHENGKVRVSPFAPLPRAARRELEEEARGLEALHS
jgi:winged helix DNA-binding protein